MSAQETSTTAPPPLALSAPSDAAEEAEKITVNGTQTFKFDKLGPVVVNKDGVRFHWFIFCSISFFVLTGSLQTLSRIANWEEMTPIEKERTLRVLVARNQ